MERKLKISLAIGLTIYLIIMYAIFSLAIFNALNLSCFYTFIAGLAKIPLDLLVGWNLGKALCKYLNIY